MTIIKQLKKYRHLFLNILAGVVAVASLWMIIYMFSFLVLNLNKALDIQLVPPTPVLFDTQGFEQLHLIPDKTAQ
ncbi:MAG: hypothetical protein UW92_C0042G0006 [Candidatus Jorgensenbacteria bacterium GW2011_GWA2_45_13]|uniref:Uncharacterized protein n=1 Tax=Candidatus Jorgensenbacteria bacterium GW2011_GWA2_45_13 TaxID=1618662 RepID=A0A0G1P1E7_9BACT|nr:MAG: hypothetical protein UW92_C0042G0006 [Candidatus Jorgensenbacteria bacterium GW2011_GWA2_45_13]